MHIDMLLKIAQSIPVWNILCHPADQHAADEAVKASEHPDIYRVLATAHVPPGKMFMVRVDALDKGFTLD